MRNERCFRVIESKSFDQFQNTVIFTKYINKYFFRNDWRMIKKFWIILMAVFAATASISALLISDQSQKQQCIENEVCPTNSAQVCKNNTCVSACRLHGMRECVCDSEEDNYCYLCCGSESNRCLPAHQHGILRPTGERWERESCSRCRMNGAEMEGLACDDRDPQRLCLQGKCSKSVCHNKQQGTFCDRKLEKICVEDICENPCAKISPHLMVCDCSMIDPDTGFASDDRCQLCCYDFNSKPSSRRCQNAFRKYHITTSQKRPIWRVGLDCAGGKTCNRYGVCAASSAISKNGVLLIASGILWLLSFKWVLFCFQ